MIELKTISDSKKVFHVCFPFVIAPIYRRITDELLVELHLLNHQKNFKPTHVFALGLIKVFEEFMQGYRPEEHKTKLFDALCKSNNIDSNEIRKKADVTAKEFAKWELEDIEVYFNKQESDWNDLQKTGLDYFDKPGTPYSRLSVIGLYTLLKGLKTNKEDKILKETMKAITESIGFNNSRVERDISAYENNIEKMRQALELMKESIKREQRKKKERENN